MFIAVLTAGVLLVPVGGQAAGSPADSEWKLGQALGDTASRLFYDVSATGPRDAWTVGRKAAAGGTGFEAAIEHWNGTEWSDVPAADTGGRPVQLQLVSAHAPDGALAAGVYLDAKPQSPPAGVERLRPGAAVAAAGTPIVLEHWDGKAWSTVARPAPPEGWLQFPGDLKSFAADSAWLTTMDWNPSANEYRYQLEHWDGAQWRTVPLPAAPGGGPVEPWGIDGTGPGDVWVTAGTRDAGGKPAPLLYHWNGTEWQQTAPPVPSEHPAGWLVNRVVAAGPGSVYAFGKTDEDFPSATMAVRWDGARWQPMPAVPVGEVNAAGADGAGALWVGGWPQGGRHSVLARWSGSAWVTGPLPPEVAAQAGENGQSSILGLERVPGTAGIIASGLVADEEWTKDWGLLVTRLIDVHSGQTAAGG
ncbi:hypothetical protein [Amycolatopsis nigrescens]|uniref:hypothetical protein n=1 Tax=Amycolatopsis nigrescens TaxID=381445 RepID=UPI0012FA8334|nr:hypothetical protein [Amycolatopsis nigrescens]